MISHKDLLDCLHYDPHSGVFTWRVSTNSRVRAGARAGFLVPATDCHNAEWRVGFCGKKHLAHRLAFFYMTARWPREVDHINRNTLDNRWDNLREVTHAENEANKAAYRNSKTGIKGIFRQKNGTFRVAVQRNWKRVELGIFTSIEAAVEARRSLP